MPDQRGDEIVDVFERHFSDVMDRDQVAFRQRFRKMANDPFAFFRGSACLFYHDVHQLEDPWATDDSTRVWIHGDLHAENFGTYMDARGMLVFDVNDFDEAYLGHWTWDVCRCAASLALLLWNKAFPDDVIDDVIERYVRGYIDQVRLYLEEDDDHEWALHLDNSRGAVLASLRAARSASRHALLDDSTRVLDQVRTFTDGGGARRLDDDEHERVIAAYRSYLDTIPDHRRQESEIAYDVKDIVGRSGFGIGSAGLISYNVLIEGRSQALENDVVLTIKEGVDAVIGTIVEYGAMTEAIEHHGHRTALSQHALQAHADPFLGWTSIGDTGFVVSERSPYEADLDWSHVSEPDEVIELVEDLGKATAKVHCASDADASGTIVDAQVEGLVDRDVGADVDGLVHWVRDFATSYAASTRHDHTSFVEAFRGGAFQSVDAT